jgi:hypothetical protein
MSLIDFLICVNPYIDPSESVKLAVVPTLRWVGTRPRRNARRTVSGTIGDTYREIRDADFGSPGRGPGTAKTHTTGGVTSDKPPVPPADNPPVPPADNPPVPPVVKPVPNQDDAVNAVLSHKDTAGNYVHNDTSHGLARTFGNVGGRHGLGVGAALGGALGAGVGALTAKDDEKAEGAIVGGLGGLAVGGALGGAAGMAYRRKAYRPFVEKHKDLIDKVKAEGVASLPKVEAPKPPATANAENAG